MFLLIRRTINLLLFRKKWRKLNSHNYTVAKVVFPIDQVSVGKMTYGPLEVHTWGSNNEFLKIGDFVSIASGVKFLLGGNHRHDTFSTYPFRSLLLKNGKDSFSKGEIVVGDDVWIGTDAMILSGIEIGKGAVVAARSLVSKDVPPYAIVGGNPAKVIKYRFDPSLIEKLMKIDHSSIKKEMVEVNESDFYQELNHETLEKITEAIKL